MELEEAEQVAIRERRRIIASSMSLANEGKPRDLIEEWDFRARCEREDLAYWPEQQGRFLVDFDLPVYDYGSGGQVHIVYHDVIEDRFWKRTFPNESGRRPTGFFTPVGYLRRLGLSNQVMRLG